MSVTIKCQRHPKYRALFEPKADCYNCCKLYDTARAFAPSVVYPPDNAIKGRYYCNPNHCGKYWTDKKERDKHIKSAYAILD